MLVKLGDGWVNSSAVASLRRVLASDGTLKGYAISYEDGSSEQVACTLDLDESLALVPAPQDHAVLVVGPDGSVEEHALLLFQADPNVPRQPPFLITAAGRFALSQSVGLRGPSGRVSTAETIYETQSAFCEAASAVRHRGRS